ncbi:hypothetical protein [Conexibacter sp. SYSU D00693]|uniref:hypothetical protein n=1 Tax=Conexibacter sp. SYSU D00693 TaxID=2812560 RepID=UPI00196B5FCF|nr:hypothetical protein [Conexibacter sp. SYSU D00693]
MRRLTALVTVALLAAGGVAGCGSDDEANRYVGQVNEAQEAFAGTVKQLETGISATSTPEQDRRTLTRFRGAVDDVVARLRRIDPPGEVAQLHQRLTSVIGRYGTEIDRFKTAAGSSNPQRVLAAETDFKARVSRISADINGAIKQINDELGAS